jgi:hypothetical protein
VLTVSEEPAQMSHLLLLPEYCNRMHLVNALVSAVRCVTDTTVQPIAARVHFIGVCRLLWPFRMCWTSCSSCWAPSQTTSPSRHCGPWPQSARAPSARDRCETADILLCANLHRGFACAQLAGMASVPQVASNNCLSRTWRSPSTPMANPADFKIVPPSIARVSSDLSSCTLWKSCIVSTPAS